MTNNNSYHEPIMLTECINGLQIKPTGTYIDATFGGGGHAQAIFKKLNSKGQLIAFDHDKDAKENAWEASNFKLIYSNFQYITNHLNFLGINNVDGIIADLGVSSHQLNEKKRGFSIRHESKLDMRMNQNSETSAKDIVNDYNDTDLLKVFQNYGEIFNAKKLVNKIQSARESKQIQTTKELIEIVKSCAPKNKEYKYFAKVFQALRIETNNELMALESLLSQCEKVVKKGGRLVVISYHSLEDRLIKNYMKRGSISGEIKKDFFGNILKPFQEITRKPLKACEEELKKNNRSRSAKLRIAERNGQ